MVCGTAAGSSSVESNSQGISAVLDMAYRSTSIAVLPECERAPSTIFDPHTPFTLSHPSSELHSRLSLPNACFPMHTIRLLISTASSSLLLMVKAMHGLRPEPPLAIPRSAPSVAGQGGRGGAQSQSNLDGQGDCASCWMYNHRQ